MRAGINNTVAPMAAMAATRMRALRTPPRNSLSLRPPDSRVPMTAPPPTRRRSKLAST